MDIKAVVSAKGQVVIPKLMREAMGLHRGSELIINLRDDDVLEVRPIKRDLTNFFGMGKRIIRKYGLAETPTDVDKAIAQAIEENN